MSSQIKPLISYIFIFILGIVASFLVIYAYYPGPPTISSDGIILSDDSNEYQYVLDAITEQDPDMMVAINELSKGKIAVIPMNLNDNKCYAVFTYYLSAWSGIDPIFCEDETSGKLQLFDFKSAQDD